MDPTEGRRVGPAGTTKTAGVPACPSSPQASSQRVHKDIHTEEALKKVINIKKKKKSSVTRCETKQETFLVAISAHNENKMSSRIFSQLTCRSGFLCSLPALLPLMLKSRGDTMPTKSKVSSLRNWIHVKSISQPWFSSHSSSSRLHRQLI